MPATGAGGESFAVFLPFPSLREPSRSAVLEHFWLIPEAPDFSESLEFCVKYLLFIAKSAQFYRKFGKLKKKPQKMIKLPIFPP